MPEPAPEPNPLLPPGAYSPLPGAGPSEPVRAIPLKPAPPPSREPPPARSRAAAAAALVAALAVAATIAAAAWGPGVAYLTKLLYPHGAAAAAPPATAAAVRPGVARLGPSPGLSGPAKDSTELWSSQAPGSSGITMDAREDPPPAPEEKASIPVDEHKPVSGPPPPIRAKASALRVWRGGAFGTLVGGAAPPAPTAPAAAPGALPPQLAAIAAREIAAHPEILPVIQKLLLASKTDDQTGGFHEATKHCGELYQCVRNGKQIAFILSDGLRVDYQYMPLLAWGLRNKLHVTTPSGESADYSDSPLVLDLSGRGLRPSAELVSFDMRGAGSPALLRGRIPGAGVLAFGAASDGRFLFGNRTRLGGRGGFADGFQALRAFAERAAAAGVISRRALARGRLGPRELRALERAYGLRVLLGGVDGRAVTLRDAGVGALRLPRGAGGVKAPLDEAGDRMSRAEGASFERMDGSAGDYADVWFRARAAKSPATAR